MENLESRTDSRERSSGISVTPFFISPWKSAFENIEWEKRDCAITNDRGEVVFEQLGVEVPKFWSQMAANVVVSKFFRGEVGTNSRETSVKDFISRVTNAIASWGEKDGYFETGEDSELFKDELSYILAHQYASFNSPVWFNVGINERPQCSACFIVSVEDSLESILELQTIEARLFKYGSGTGSNLSSLRSSRERLSGGGIPSGPVSFMRGFDAWAGIIKSGGKTRRAAKMQILNATHPDIREFIRAKSDEEKKAWALIEQGYDGGFAVQGGAYESAAFQNANLSVRADDDFMNAAENNEVYNTVKVATGAPCESLEAREILRMIAEGTHLCGDPGMQFHTTINAWHTCPNSGTINASNPCSEYMHVDNSACNLSSLNLLRFLKEDGKFDTDAFEHTVRVMMIAQDILIDRSSYPTKKIENNAGNFRQLGLGYANLGALLMNLGLPYDSDEGRALAAAVTALMTGEAYRTSADLAEVKGAFSAFKKNRDPMLKVLEKHREALSGIPSLDITEDILAEAYAVWEAALENGSIHGFRNSQATVLAPTGTISFMMDCDTTGIEPDIALVKYKKLVGGGMLKLVNKSVPRALARLGYRKEEISEIIRFIDENHCIEGAPALKPEHLAVFDCAFKAEKGTRIIRPEGHIKMMAAVQPFISGAISKTVNLPESATVEEINDIYLKSWKMGLKAVALYRDGSKRTQPLSTASGDKHKEKEALPVRRRLTDERPAITHKFQVGGLEGYLTVGLYEDGRPGEIFLAVAKEGSTLSGVMDAFATSISIALQYGVPLETLVRKFSYLRFEPSGFTGNKAIPMANSVIDYIFRWLGHKFLSASEITGLGLSPLRGTGTNPPKPSLIEFQPDNTEGNGGFHPGDGAASALFRNSEDAPPCTNCGSSLMVRQAGCYVCLNCGSQGGCG